MIQVVLSSRGFADMVERTTYLERIASQDHKIITKVTRLKGETKKETVKLAGLENEACAPGRRRSAAAATKSPAPRARSPRSATSSPALSASRKSKLAVVSKSLRNDEEDLAAMQASNGSVMQAPSTPARRSSAAPAS